MYGIITQKYNNIGANPRATRDIDFGIICHHLNIKVNCDICNKLNALTRIRSSIDDLKRSIDNLSKKLDNKL